MARRSNGGIIGKFTLPSASSAGGVFSVNEAAAYTAVGQFPVGTIVNVSAPLVEQIGTALKPTITSVVYTDNNYREISAGANTGPVTGASLRIRGQNFLPNTRIYVNGNIVNTQNKYVNSTETRTANITLAAGSYTLMAFNTSNIGSIYQPGVQFRAATVWITNPTLAATAINTSFSYTLSASDLTTVTYTVVPGTALPTGVALNSASGVLSGLIATAGTYTISIYATNAYGLATQRDFSLSITPPSYTFNYLVVGGGGSGASANAPQTGGSGGGGAGGVQIGSYASLIGATFTVGIGAGGTSSLAFSPTSGSQGKNGGNSYITGTTLGNIVSVGGGGGMFGQSPTVFPGGSGGGGGPGAGASGQGFRFPSPAPLFYTATGAQGYPGGVTSGPPNGAPTIGGGGGGAGGAGITSGTGGPGYTWPINGVTYAGGGGGNSNAGGPGGGAPGGNNPAVPGTNGLGGGGGAGTPSGTIPSGAGGSGTVVIAYPTVPGVRYGSGGTETVSGGYYLHTFTSPGTYTA
jgi:hypothetical protein